MYMPWDDNRKGSRFGATHACTLLPKCKRLIKSIFSAFIFFLQMSIRNCTSNDARYCLDFEIFFAECELATLRNLFVSYIFSRKQSNQEYLMKPRTERLCSLKLRNERHMNFIASGISQISVNFNFFFQFQTGLPLGTTYIQSCSRVILQVY